jgi:hypothetical protein
MKFQAVEFDNCGVLRGMAIREPVSRRDAARFARHDVKEGY